MLNKTVKISGILCLIALLTALLLGVTNEATNKTIIKRQQEVINAAMAEVIPARTYNLLKKVPDEYELYAALNGDDLVGYAVSLAETGYGGDIKMMIGVTADTEPVIAGISITEMSETPGLGDNARKPEFTDMFKGLPKDELSLTRDSGKIQAISGATITSNAFVRGTNRAIDIVSSHTSGGANDEQ